MTGIGKLYTSILSTPRASVPFRDFERLLRAFGFALVRTNGSHRQYGHPKATRILSVQPRGKDAKSYQVEQFVDMVDEFGLSLEEL